MMKMRRRKLILILLVLFALAGGRSCQRQDVGYTPLSNKDFVPVELALSVGTGSYETKADVDVITELKDNSSFRGLKDLRIIPFATETKITPSDPTLSYVLNLPDIGSDGLLAKSQAHLFSGNSCALPLRTASVLVYGRAPKASGEGEPATERAAIDAKHMDGSLVEQGLTGTNKVYVSNASDIGFAPETMLLPEPGTTTVATPAAANTIAAALTSVVQGEAFSISAYYDGINYITVSTPWDGNIGNEQLRSCYKDLTANGALMPGSGINVASLLTSLYRNLGVEILNPFQYEVEKDGNVYPAKKKDGTPLTYADIYNGVREMVIKRIEQLKTDGTITISEGSSPEIAFADPNVADYPENLGLPSGAAVVRWTPTGYVVPLENGLDGIAPISAYCYPPALYYYANTTIRTANDASKASERAEAYVDGKTWETIKEQYPDGRRVSTNTCAVALEDSLNFAVSMLVGTVKVSSDKLSDNDGSDATMVEINEGDFPLTGIIIGRQYPVSFDFTPIYVSEERSKQHYLYDNQISGISLSTGTEEPLPEFRTLSLQTPVGKEVYFALEFLNHSDKSFVGAEGRILPGHKFYLVGKFYFPENTEHEQIFQKDYYTTAHCVIKTFKNAHSAVPDLGIPQLNLGVETVVNWALTPSTTVIME